MKGKQLYDSTLKHVLSDAFGSRTLFSLSACERGIHTSSATHQRQCYPSADRQSYASRRPQEVEIETQWQEIEFDLAQLCNAAGVEFPIDAIYLFGSRRFRTDSVRSDIDVLFEANEHIRPAHIRAFIDRHCQALDIFLLSNGKATSAANESYVCGDNNDDVLNQCDAVKLWSRKSGLEEGGSIHWRQMYASHVNFYKTALPNARIQISLDGLKRRLASERLPTDPIIGETESEVAKRLFRIAESVSEFKSKDFPGKGSASGSFVVNPSSEYDFQDLFWVCTKPWIQSINREVVIITFDGQKKKADFSIGGSRLVIELKFARNTDDKRTIAKTLDGLKRFYSENANVKCLIFIVYAKRAANIDAFDWQERYSNFLEMPRVALKVIQVD